MPDSQQPMTRLQYIRIKLMGRKLCDLARECGISSPWLSRIERMEKRPPVWTLVRVACVYGVTVEELEADFDKLKRRPA